MMADYETLKSRVDTDDGTYWWALMEIERLREALRRIEEMKDVRTPAAVRAVARAALGEGK